MSYALTLYDIGGGPKIRGIWKNYLAEAHGYVYVVQGSTTVQQQQQGATGLQTISELEDRRLQESVHELKRVWNGSYADEDPHHQHKDEVTFMSGKPILLLVNKPEYTTPTATATTLTTSTTTTTTSMAGGANVASIHHDHDHDHHYDQGPFVQRLRTLLEEQKMGPIVLPGEEVTATSDSGTIVVRVVQCRGGCYAGSPSAQPPAILTAPASPFTATKLHRKTKRSNKVAPTSKPAPPSTTTTTTTATTPTTPAQQPLLDPRIDQALEQLLTQILRYRAPLETRIEKDLHLQTRRLEREQEEKRKRVEEYRREQEVSKKAAELAEGELSTKPKPKPTTCTT